MKKATPRFLLPQTIRAQPKKLRPLGSYLQSFTHPWKMIPDPASVIFNGRGIVSHCKLDNVSPVS